MPSLELSKKLPPRSSLAMAGWKHMAPVQLSWICHRPILTLLSADSMMWIMQMLQLTAAKAATKDLRRTANLSKRAKGKSPKAKAAAVLAAVIPTISKRDNRRHPTRTMSHSHRTSLNINRLSISSNILRSTISTTLLHHQAASRYYDWQPSLSCSHGLCKSRQSQLPPSR